MLKKVIFIVVIIIVLAMGAFLAYHFLVVKSDDPDATLRDSLPFGPRPDPIDINGVPPNDFPENGLDSDLPDTENGTELDPGDPQAQIPTLREIWSEPVAGGVAFGGGRTHVRFVERAGGDILETSSDTLETRRVAETRFSPVYQAFWANSNTLITRNLRANLETIESREITLSEEGDTPFFFGENLEIGDRGEAVRELQRQLNRDPDTQVAPTGPGSFGNETNLFGPATENAVKRLQAKYSEEILDPQGLEEGTGAVDNLTREKLNELSGWKEWQERDDVLLGVSEKVLDLGIPGTAKVRELTISPEGNRAFLLKTTESGSEGFIRDLQTGTETKVFESPLQEWRVGWSSPNRIALATKPSNSIPGFLYLLNINTGDLDRILGGVPGLVASVNGNSNKVLYSEIDGSSWNSKILNRETKEVFNLGNLRVLPEKCVWSQNDLNIVYCAVPRTIPGDVFPDAWYQGRVALADSLWRINAETGEAQSLSNLTPSQGGSIDVLKPFLSPNEEYLFFINKNNLSFWSIKLTNN